MAPINPKNELKKKSSISGQIHALYELFNNPIEGPIADALNAVIPMIIQVKSKNRKKKFFFLQGVFCYVNTQCVCLHKGDTFTNSVTVWTKVPMFFDPPSSVLFFFKMWVNCGCGVSLSRSSHFFRTVFLRRLFCVCCFVFIFASLSLSRPLSFPFRFC